jgi:hypothetical protein
MTSDPFFPTRQPDANHFLIRVVMSEGRANPTAPEWGKIVTGDAVREPGGLRARERPGRAQEWAWLGRARGVPPSERASCRGSRAARIVKILLAWMRPGLWGSTTLGMKEV